MDSQLTMSLSEVARLLGITTRSLSNRLSRGDPCPPHIRLSQRRRIWLKSTVTPLELKK